MAALSLKLPEDLKERLDKVARRFQQAPHAYIVEAIAERLERDEKRQAFWDDGRNALEEYERTGISYRAEDVHKYLLALAQGKKVRRPKPIKDPKAGR
jgi:predicted transcriptional regulator